MEQHAAERVSIHRARVDAAAQFQLAELPGVEAQAAVEHLGEPVAERLLAADRSLELELRFVAGAQDGRHLGGGDLRGAAAVAHDQRGEDEGRQAAAPRRSGTTSSRRASRCW